jgi:hypothetical protein
MPEPLRAILILLARMVSSWKNHAYIKWKCGSSLSRQCNHCPCSASRILFGLTAQGYACNASVAQQPIHLLAIPEPEPQLSNAGTTALSLRIPLTPPPTRYREKQRSAQEPSPCIVRILILWRLTLFVAMVEYQTKFVEPARKERDELVAKKPIWKGPSRFPTIRW